MAHVFLIILALATLDLWGLIASCRFVSPEIALIRWHVLLMVVAYPPIIVRVQMVTQTSIARPRFALD